MKVSHGHNGVLPAPSGQYLVGCTDVMVGPDVADGCFLRLYFPCKPKNPAVIDENSYTWADWMPHPKYAEGYATVIGIPIFMAQRVFNWIFGNVWIPTVMDAEPIKDKEFPVIVFSHGLTACRTSYSVICSEMASHGFIVAAIEHREGSACLSYSLVKDSSKDEYMEEWVYYKPMEFQKEDMPLRQEQLQHRIRECQRTLDILTKLNKGTDIDHVLHSKIDLSSFKGTLDLSNPVLAGHSFGSATVLRTLAVDKRFKIGVALDAWMWPLKDEKELHKSIEQPILFINMEAFQTPNNLTAMKRFIVDAEHTERRVVTLKGSVHKNQVDLVFMVPFYLRRLMGLNSRIDAHVAMNLNNFITLLYLRKHLGHTTNEEQSAFIESHKEWIYEGIP